MWPLLGSGRSPFDPVSCFRFVRRLTAHKVRRLSFIKTSREKESEFRDPPLPSDTSAPKDILSSISTTDPGTWSERKDGASLFGESPVVPAVIWQENFSESDAYWQQKKQQQLKLEENFVFDALEKHNEFVRNVRSREQVATLSFARDLLYRWFQPLRDGIAKEQQKLLKSARNLSEASQHLLVLEPDELAIITVHAVLGIMLKGNYDDKDYNGNMPFVDVASRVGKAVQAQINLLKLRHRVDKENRRRMQLNRYIEQLKGEKEAPLSTIRPDFSDNIAEWERRLIKRCIEMDKKIRMLRNRWSLKSTTLKDVLLSQWTLEKQQSKWSDGATIQVGALLVNAFKEHAIAQVDRVTGKLMGSNATSTCVNQPVLKHEVVWKKGKRGKKQLGVLSIHPSILQRVESAEAHSTWALSRSYPMVCPPLPWTCYDSGAYLTIPSRMVRSFDNSEPALLVKEADTRGQLDRVYAALTILGKTPWALNKEMFKVVEQVWKSGGGKLGMPSRINVPLPPEPKPYFKSASHKGALHVSYMGETSQEAYFRKTQVARVRKKNAEMHSLRCDMELKLGVARKFMNEERLYFPHNIDFRGRAYPIPPHLNHIGNDMCRGLLLFADARPLGKNGLDWLYIQIANLYGAGENKKSQGDRRNFGIRSLDKILDSANDPLGGLQWWMTADSPWQLLATCMEIKDALNHDSPETFLSRLHVHQDGSCNGLQHYAALGRDAPGAEAVNLRQGDKPNDVYTELSKSVKKTVEDDAAAGHKYAQILDGHVDRKLVKQTVMTSVYGVTFVGARQQIENRLRERGWEDTPELFYISAYAAKVTLAGLHEMFKNAKDVMHWLATCAERIASTGQIVKWTTPLGLPVGQPYRNTDKHSVKTVLQTVSLARRQTDMPIMKRRQRTAFPPNYIHSIDSTHMMLTALECYQQNVTFAGVHDSFWTHAGSVDSLNRILREKFYELHSRPLIKELSEQFRETYKDAGVVFPPVPESGDFDLRDILDAEYFFN